MRTIKLANGIPIILENVTGTEVVTALVLFKVGSRCENKQNNGVSHFVEHLFFKGTTKRPSTLAISQELDGVGAHYNAFTTKDITGYYIKVAQRHTKLALDVLADILFNPLFPAAEIDKERGVITEEINMYEDNPMVSAEELVEEVFFGKNHPLGYRIAGPKKNIATMSRNNIIKYRDSYYHPGNMVIILSGKVPSDAPQVLKKYFVNVSIQAKRTKPARRFKCQQKQARVVIQKKDTAQAHLALSFSAPSYTSPEAPIADVLSVILGGNMSSRLFINVRDKKALCYYINSHISALEDTGILTIQAGLDKNRIVEAVAAIAHELQELRHKGVSDDELRKAKEYIRGMMSILLEDSENIASWWGKQALFHKKMNTPAQYLQKIQAVRSQQIQHYAQKTLRTAYANLAVIGPYTQRLTARLRRQLVI